MIASAAPLRTPRRDVIQRLLQLTGPRPHVVVAFSGGVDSTVLAHALGGQRRQLGGLRLVHVDHGLQAASGDWAGIARRVARACACRSWSHRRRRPAPARRVAGSRGARRALRAAGAGA